MRTEGKGHETIRKYEQLFKQMNTFAFDKGIRFVSEFDLSLLEEFRSTWPDGDLSKQKKLDQAVLNANGFHHLKPSARPRVPESEPTLYKSSTKK
jgi:hypothetical protein